ncbi:regulatory protein RecX [Kushneria sp. TE3]|uniref:regulatory protein RecX n=1 Tax=Kushneria sp. TE3 TaxID=3449832 RepID=UPI003F6855F5
MSQRTPYEEAIALLARREYTRSELEERLLRHEHSPEEVTALLDRLAADGFQSDARFVEHFVRSRIARLQGPRKISAELSGRGIEREMIAHALEESDADWTALAIEALQRRFDGPGDDMKARAKRQRFLASRGFNGQQCSSALRTAWSS